MRVAGVVLCGGRSSRMGRPKAWLPFGDELLLPRVVRLLAEVVGPVVVVAAPGQDVPPLPADVAVVRDPVEHQGPLRGLATGLEAIRDKADAAYLSSCDVPLLRPGFVRRVVASSGEAAIAVPRTDGHHHPLAAVYRIEPVLAAARSLLAANRLRLASLFDILPTTVLGPDAFADVDPALVSLRNANTPQEYAAALDARDEGALDTSLPGR